MIHRSVTSRLADLIVFLLADHPTEAEFDEAAFYVGHAMFTREWERAIR